MIQNHESIDVFIGVDVGKTNHHAVAMNRAGKKLFDKALPQDETKLNALISSLAKRGTLLFVVDQPATIGALPAAVAPACGIQVGYLPGYYPRINRLAVSAHRNCLSPIAGRAAGPRLFSVANPRLSSCNPRRHRIG